MYPCFSRPEGTGILPGIFLTAPWYDITLTPYLIVQHTDYENAVVMDYRYVNVSNPCLLHQRHVLVHGTISYASSFGNI
jgi:hypothetical protein